jgi:hypothetical protein
MWVASAISLALLLMWLLRPGLVDGMRVRVIGAVGRGGRRPMQGYARRWESEDV